LNEFLRPVWAEINLSNIRYNIRNIKAHLKEGVEVIAVVKADAYGHGSKRVSQVLIQEGVKIPGSSDIRRSH